MGICKTHNGFYYGNNITFLRDCYNGPVKVYRDISFTPLTPFETRHGFGLHIKNSYTKPVKNNNLLNKLKKFLKKA